ncbi:HDIG domain-containing protein [Clostridium botulinum C]|uniref:HDIG domain-containing protein n=2 Tax=Clostridium botulinum TaxID=1491 RepID=A0A9Q4XXX6_CLOBO|nr:HDIG domain-containing metalloprotein [Clostridium botulinum]EGO88458.1 phosphohydrolase [Clostridium botulinum C str. Stockholm]MCD3195064.1 HDIG domain-containing protein [Clostridium botulinum C]MCD3200404.1 HDIG domain-containing protein [Clostridium botulinum C]MCD3205822.1 HDIG domain-containing protein [Clostridium botulinum C]MCD3208273.1 HDIG domain-containing protein [Clostridium botulinum C]
MNEKINLYEQIEAHLLQDKMPSKYIEKLTTNEVFCNYPFTMIRELINIPQSPKYHPEGSVWKHTLLVIDNAAENRRFSENPKVFMWAALLHDIGKVTTTKIKKGKITSYEHDIQGAVLAMEFLENFTQDNEFIKKVSSMIRWHMQVLFLVKNLPYSDIEKMLSEVSLDEIALLSLCDRLGRGELTKEKERIERENIKEFKEKCKRDYIKKNYKVEIK